MPLTIDDVKKAREWGIQFHQPWKAQVKVNDAIAAGQWEILWDDDTVDASDPLVQNVYLGSIEDKVSAATSGAPSIFVPPPPGTAVSGRGSGSRCPAPLRPTGSRSSWPFRRRS